GRPHEVPAAALHGPRQEQAHADPRRRDLRLRAGGISLPVPPRVRDRHVEVRRVSLMEAAMALALTSPGFGANGSIPTKHTCEGSDVSPALAWSAVPAGAKSLVLIVDDPDAPDPKAPQRTWVHWVLYNIPPTAAGLPEGVATASLPAGPAGGLEAW